ncbi:uncharacterized protein LOC105838180 isoform X2 [Monomorium pharaonis]|nr:uncharacterized protein LOC105838180 isoform X2 [Monomorium pharaonis]
MPEKEKLLQELEIHNDFDVDEDDIDEDDVGGDDERETEESYYNPPTKKKCRNKQDKRWLEADEILITAVQMRPCLWDHTINVKKRNTLNVSEAWLDVLKELKDYKFNLEDVKKRWRNLRDSFNKSRKKKTLYIPRGSAVPTTNDSFRHYGNMLFLIDKVKPRPTKSNISEKMSHSCGSSESFSISIDANVITIENPMEDIDKDDSLSTSLSTSGINSNVSENSSFIEHTKRSRKKPEETVEFKKQLVNNLSECNKSADGIDGFLVHLGDILKKLPYKERRALQKEILDSAYKAEERAGLI